jgi:hypothetical protein
LTLETAIVIFSAVKKSGVLQVVITTCALSLIAAHLSPATAAPAAQIISCVDLASGKERISKTGTCRTTEATAKWHLAQSDSALASGGTTKSLTICSNKESSPVTYQRIRASCYKHMQTNFYTRSAALPAKPVITQVSSTSYESASLALASDPAANVDAPIAYYTITSSKGDVMKVNSWRELTFTVSGLRSATSYTFTITATSVDGTSPVSESSLPVTTPAYVAPVASATTVSLAAPAFTLSASAETKTVNTAITGYTISSTGGTIASYAISPSAPAGLTFNTATGILSGTPSSTQSATAYTITATNAGGSTSVIFTLTVASAPPAAPAFTLSSTAETKTVNNSITGYTISSTGGTIASYSISPAAPAGTTFSTSNGLLTGTPTSSQNATAYTITATNASGSATRAFTLTVTAVTNTVGQTGPGGGTIFYVALSPFACGPTRSATCTYLEAAPSGWNSGVEPNASWAQMTPVNYRNTSVGSSGSPETATATAIGWGYRNTRAIILQGNTDTATSAAALADSYTATISGVTYDDWYLPSKDELNQMCKWVTNQAWVSDATACTGGTINTGTGAAGFVEQLYWSSTEGVSPASFYQYFHINNNGLLAKYNSGYVRPIRAF